MHVTELWLYPMKSMLGSRVSEADFTSLGMVGDRAWALRDIEGGFLANTRQTPRLMQFAAAPLPTGHVAITMPGGRELTSADDDADDVLSEELGRAVRLERLQPADDLDFYRRTPDPSVTDPMAHLREIFAREDDEPLPDFTKFGPNVMEFESPPGTFYDCFPLMIMSTSALRSMAGALPQSVIDVRRFRPTFVVDTGDQPGHPEFDWSGRRFAIGSAVVEIVNDCPRCAAITKEIDERIPQDRAILRHVVKDLGQAVGVYANVVQPGTITQGDDLLPL